jgi:hypothetical protein
MASLVSALILSFIFTIINHNNSEGVLYYSFSTKFLNGSLLLFCIYFFIGTPISFYIDKNIRDNNKFKQIAQYFLVGVLLGIIFVILKPIHHFMSGIQLVLMFGVASCIFALFLQLFRFIIKKR